MGMAMATLAADISSNEIEKAWETVADLKLRLRDVVSSHKHQYRGASWLIIADQENEKYFRCSNNAEPFLSLLDGSRSVDQALTQSNQSHKRPLLKSDVILLMGNLKSAGLLESDETLLNKPATSRWRNPLAVKFALIDPDAMLQNTVHWFRPLFTPMALVFWMGAVLVGLSIVMLNWQGLVEHGEARFADPKNLLWYWLLYPVVKVLHEFAHAYATKVWGGAVREMGITFLVFFPVPYVDSSAAHSFSSKYRRMTVCGSGIMVELFLVSLALLVWTSTGPSLVRDLAFDIIIIGGVSTLLFNANPLLRFDGYYLLSELIEIPNLATRSDQYLGYLFKRYLLNIPDLRTPVSADGEVKWLVVYGICARIYRTFIGLFIAFWIASKFLIVGLALALWAIAGQIIYPFFSSIAKLVPQVIQANRVKRFYSLVVVASMLVIAILVVPVGHSTYSEGVVNLSENALIRANTSGIVTSVQLADGDTTNKGDSILTLEDIDLEAQVHNISAKLTETLAKQQSLFLRDRTQTDTLKARASAIAEELRMAKEQLAHLNVVSTTSGVVSLPKANDLLGRYVRRGDVVGYVAAQQQATALVAIPEADIDIVRRDMNSIEVKLSSRPGVTLDAEFIKELPLATDRLPHRILGSGSGGKLSVDARDKAGVQLLSNIFLVEITLPLETTGSYLGQRIYVRFNHKKERLGVRLVRRLNQMLLLPPFV